jgi:hypothetical protein
VLASALEDTANDPAIQNQPRYCRRWWALRMWPILFCLPPAAQTSMRGQVNHIVLALLCLFSAGVLRQQRVRAGIYLAFAICIKVIPVYLLVYPLWKRDGRALLGCGLGLFLGLVAIPLAILGPARMTHQYQRYGEVFFAPLFGVGDDTSRHDELLGINNTDSVGLRNALYNWTYFNPAQRPPFYPPAIVWGYRVVGGLMTLLVLWPGTFGPRRGPWFDLAQFAALIVLMAILSPICHLHYFIFCLPLVATLIAHSWERHTSLHLRPVLVVILAIFIVMNIVPSLPGLARLKDLCVNMFSALPLWGAGVVQLWRWAAPQPAVALAAPAPRLAA